MEGLGYTSTPQTMSQGKRGETFTVAVELPPGVPWTQTVVQATALPAFTIGSAGSSISVPPVVPLAQQPGPPLPLEMANGTPQPTPLVHWLGNGQWKSAADTSPISLPPVIACPSISAPPVVSLAQRPGPPLPSTMANGKPLPSRVFNPFEDAAPRGTFESCCDSIIECVTALLGLSNGEAAQRVLLLGDEAILRPIDLDQEMRDGGYCAFLIHSKTDVLMAGLEPDLAKKAFEKVAADRGATFVVAEARTMIPLIDAAAKRAASDHTIYDDFTTRFGYSTGQLSALGTRPSGEALARAVARGGPASLHFTNDVEEELTLGASRANFRQQMVDRAIEASDYFRTKWVPRGRPRVTAAFRTACKWVRAPFTTNASLPLASDTDQIALATWESALRGVEEHMMFSLFGSLPNVTWARILAKVFEKAEAQMGEFDVDNYRQWAAAEWGHAHGVGPGKLGCPWKSCAGRVLPKGALGQAPFKPMHDDDNGVICLGCWTSVTEADQPVDLVFLINGVEVSVGASALRSVLFMGYIPHESRPRDPHRPATTPRVHHSSFVKPEAEHLAAHVLSKLPCKRGGGDWSMDQVHRLRAEAFEETSMKPILAKGAEERREGEDQPVD
jgi:hypothetical protein